MNFGSAVKLGSAVNFGSPKIISQSKNKTKKDHDDWIIFVLVFSLCYL